MNDIFDFIDKLTKAKSVSRRAAEYLVQRFEELLGMDKQADQPPKTKPEQAEKERVYRDEPISAAKPGLRQSRPADRYLRINQMRNIARDPANRSKSSAEIFYLQAKFMEDYEPESSELFGRSRHDQASFGSLNWTYSQMPFNNLANYFSWRTHVRRGEAARTELHFCILYALELCHLVGVKDAGEGFEKLSAFFDVYSRRDERLNFFAEKWLTDFIIYYGLDVPLPEPPESNVPASLPALLEPGEHSDDELFEALNDFSSMYLQKSRMYSKQKEKLAGAVTRVYRALVSDPSQGRERVLKDYVGVFTRMSYYPFSSVMFYDWLKRGDYSFYVKPGLRYIREQAVWYMERFVRSAANRAALTGVLKLTDYYLREELHAASRLKKPEVEPETDRLVKAVVKAYTAESKEKERPKLELDLSKLSSIRSAALETQELLLAPTEGEEDAASEARTLLENEQQKREADTAVPESNERKLSYEPSGQTAVHQEAEEKPLFTPAERLLLERLLEGRPYTEALLALGVLPSVAADGANEKLMELIGDTPIVDNGEELELIEDYIEDLKGFLNDDAD